MARPDSHSGRTIAAITVRQAILSLLSARAPDATVCPSEVARAVANAAGAASGDWRALMPMVHEAVDRLVAEGEVRLSWKGQPLAARAGPYRIARDAP